MEGRKNIREIAGIANARKITNASVEGSSVQAVWVEDGLQGEVVLYLTTATCPAGLTPEQAKLVAEQLLASAERVKKRNSKQKPEA